MSTRPMAPAPSGTGDLEDLDVRPTIEAFVRAFYRQVAMDHLLGPIFAAAHVDWPAHIDKLTDFWCWQLLGEPGYDRNPLRAHEPVDARTPFRPEHYRRWVELFLETLDEHARGPIADVAKGRATKMARALERLLAGQHGPAAAPIQPHWSASRRAAPHTDHPRRAEGYGT